MSAEPKDELERVRLKIDLIIPEPIMERIDANADTWGDTRTAVIRRALFAYLKPEGMTPTAP
jgi:hypothetical protein